MSRRTSRVALCILVGVLLQAGVLAGDSGLPPCPAGLIEGPDPIGRTCTGDSKSQKSQTPELGTNQSSGQPFMLWGEGGDIAFSSWSDGRWSKGDYVASTLAEERDPRAFAAEDGAILVTWWTPGRAPAVYYAVRDPETERWSVPRQVTDDGARPAIARVDGRVLVVFERASGRDGVDLVAATADDTGRWTEQVVQRAAGPPGLDLRVHHEQGRTWIAWQASPESLAWSSWDGRRWTSGARVPVEGSSWKAGRDARERIRVIVSRD